MGNQTFGIDSAVGYYDQVCRPSYEAFLREPANPMLSLIFSVVAYHLREWVWHDRATLVLRDSGLDATSNENFNSSVNSKCPMFPVIRDLANGLKHFKPSSLKSVKDSGVAKWGDLAWGDFASNRATLKVELDNGSSRSADSVFKEVAEFWRAFFEAQPK